MNQDEDIYQVLEALDKWAIKHGWKLVSEEILFGTIIRSYLTPQGASVKITAEKGK